MGSLRTIIWAFRVKTRRLARIILKQGRDIAVGEELLIPTNSNFLMVLDQNTISVVQLAVGFFLIFSAFNSQSFIEESVIASYAEKSGAAIRAHDGYISLAIVYGSFTLLNLLAPVIISKLGDTRRALSFGGLAYAIFMVGFFAFPGSPNRIYLFGSSILLGLGAAVIWTSQGQYLSLHSNTENAGKNSAIFWAISQSCLISGGLFMFILFGFTNASPSSKTEGSHGPSNNTEKPFSTVEPTKSSFISDPAVRLLYGVFTAITILGSLILGLLRKPRQQEYTPTGSHSSPSVSSTTSPPSSLPSPSRIVSNREENGHQQSWTEIIGETFRLARTGRMLALFPVFAYTGIELGFWSSIFPTSIASTLAFTDIIASERLIALNAIVFGAGQFCAGFFFGILDSPLRRMGRHRIVLLGAVIHLTTFCIDFLNLPDLAPLSRTSDLSIIGNPSITLVLIAGLSLGFGDACWNTQIMAQLVAEYPSSESSSAFALFKFVQSLLTSCILLFAGQNQLIKFTLRTHILLLSVSCILAAASFIAVSVRQPRRAGQTNSASPDKIKSSISSN